jgi:hypothetical protein
VRERELPCRLEWDHDLFEEDDLGDDRVIDVRTLDPDKPGPGSNGTPRNVLQRLIILSDLPVAPAVRDEWMGREIGREPLPDSIEFVAAERQALDTADNASDWLIRADLLHHLWRRRR